jgi:hypothetical protein
MSREWRCEFSTEENSKSESADIPGKNGSGTYGGVIALFTERESGNGIAGHVWFGGTQGYENQNWRIEALKEEMVRLG